MRPLPLIPLLALAACAGKDEESTEETPTVSFLAPEEGATVTAGTVDVSLVVAHMTLEDPGATAAAPSPILDWLLPGRPARAHNEGEAEGYAELRLDGAAAATVYETQAQIEGVEAGEHSLEVELFYSDGDALEPPVTATVSFTAVVTR